MILPTPHSQIYFSFSHTHTYRSFPHTHSPSAKPSSRYYSPYRPLFELRRFYRWCEWLRRIPFPPPLRLPASRCVTCHTWGYWTLHHHCPQMISLPTEKQSQYNMLSTNQNHVHVCPKWLDNFFFIFYSQKNINLFYKTMYPPMYMLLHHN